MFGNILEQNMYDTIKSMKANWQHNVVEQYTLKWPFWNHIALNYKADNFFLKQDVFVKHRK